MDSKILRSGTLAAVALLLSGVFIGSYGGWEPMINLPGNILGAVVVALVVSIFLVFVFSSWFSNFLPGSILAKGVLFGVLVWAVFLILGGLLPFFKEAVYPNTNPGSALFVSLILSSIWGAIASLSLEMKI